MISKYDVFISYVGRDRSRAEAIYEHVVAAGLTAWMDQRSLGPDRIHSTEIPRVLGTSTVALFIVSRTTAAISQPGVSERPTAKGLGYHYFQELDTSIEAHRRGGLPRSIVPVRMDGVESNAHPYLLRGYQGFDLAHAGPVPTGRECSGLIEWLRRALTDDNPPAVQGQSEDQLAGSRGAAARSSVVREVLQKLQLSDGPGVALLVRRGFESHPIFRDVRAALRSEQDYLVVELPLLRATRHGGGPSKAEFYQSLTENLKKGLNDCLGGPELPRDWRSCFHTRQESDRCNDFEAALDSLLHGPIRAQGSTLILMARNLARVDPAILEDWAWLMEAVAASGRLKLVVCGGAALEGLCTGAAKWDTSSPFDRLEKVRVAPLVREEVESRLRRIVAHADIQHQADQVIRLTGGHPACVNAAVRFLAGPRCHLPSVAALAMDMLFQSDYGQWVSHRLEQSKSMRDRVAELLRGDMTWHRSNIDSELYWLGLVTPGSNGEWKWSAPVVERLLYLSLPRASAHGEMDT